jgi:hypothetical protein
LSGEEELVLSSILEPTHNTGTFPVFINGRAGSGKSTVLLYLYSEYLYKMSKAQWEGREIEGEPLFLTYSKDLKKVAMDGVNRLFSSHIKFLDQTMPNEYIEQVKRSFYTFKELINEYIPRGELYHYNSHNYINYSTFKNYYYNIGLTKEKKKYAFQNPVSKRYSADLVWHVMRTYITGYSPEGYLSVDEYNELPTRERTVTPNGYEHIYNLIWDKWYRSLLEDADFWDDHKLLKTILIQTNVIPKYAVIFCDEAQDFTRLELKFIMNLLAYRKYDFSYEPSHCIPFAFSGDPFQTLNPTGFSWSGLKASFYDEIISQLDPTNSGKIVFNYHELTYNYRSSYPLVKFINLLQLYRSALITSERPKLQRGWQIKDNDPGPKLFVLGKNISIEQLVEYGEDTLIILPCDEGQEIDFVNHDPELTRYINETKQSNNIFWSPIKAKGLEFKRVILYKFGHHCTFSLNEHLNKYNDLNEGERLELEYFFNNLYVAASRSRQYLFIIDSNEGNEKLWKYFTDDNYISKLLNMFDNMRELVDHVNKLNYGIEENLKELVETDVLSLAYNIEKRGISTENPALLRDAKRFYLKAGKQYEADLCEARALVYENKYGEAGDLYNKYRHVEEAEDLYWKGCCWDKLHAHFKSLHSRGLRSLIAEYNSHDGAVVNILPEFVDRLYSYLDNPEKDRLLEEQVINTFTNILDTAICNEEYFDDTGFWMHISYLAEYYLSKGQSINDLYLGEVYYNARQFVKCVETWRGVHNLGKYHSHYTLAQAEIAESPLDKMKYYCDAGKIDDVINIWSIRDNRYYLFDDDLFNTVYDYLYNNNLYEDAWKLCIGSNRTGNITKLYHKIVGNDIDDKAFIKYSSQLIRIKDFKGRWNDIFDLTKYARSSTKKTDKANSTESISFDDLREYKLGILVLKYMALSDTFLDMPLSIHGRGVNLIYELANTRDKQNKLFKYISPLELGAASERTCFPENSFALYQDIFSNMSLSPEIRERARKRCLFKFRRAMDFYRSVNNEEKVEEFESKYDGTVRCLGLSLESLADEPVYPELTWKDLPHEEDSIDNADSYGQLPNNITDSEYSIVNNREAGILLPSKLRQRVG